MKEEGKAVGLFYGRRKNGTLGGEHVRRSQPGTVRNEQHEEEHQENNGRDQRPEVGAFPGRMGNVIIQQSKRIHQRGCVRTPSGKAFTIIGRRIQIQNLNPNIAIAQVRWKSPGFVRFGAIAHTVSEQPAVVACQY